MACPAEPAALAGLNPRAARSSETQQELEIERGLHICGIGTHRVGEVRDRSVNLALRTA
jgi:hypothetical protein